MSEQADYPEMLNPFASSLQKIKPSAKKLSWFKSAVVEAKSASELYKVVDQALATGMRINACNDGEWSFAEYVVLGTHFHKLEKSDRKKLIRKLMLSGAEFHDTLLQNKLIGEIYNELQPEVQPQIDKQLEGLRKVGESAVQGGSVEDVEIDNRTVFIKFSESSTVEPAKVLEGWGSHIIKIGNNEVEVKVEKGGERNYTSLSDDSDFTMTLHSDLGEVKIRLCHDRENYDRVQVIVEDKEMWQKAGGVIRENCLFGGMTVKEAVEKGNFMRCGIWNSKQLMKEVDSPSEKLFSWADKVRENSKETCRAL